MAPERKKERMREKSKQAREKENKEGRKEEGKEGERVSECGKKLQSNITC